MTSSEVATPPVEAGGRSRATRLPGEVGIWVFILADMTAFAVFFIAFAVYRRTHREAASAGHAHLHTNIALVNTVLLLLGSFLVVLAMTRLRTGTSRTASAVLFAAAALTGVSFAVNKFFEYRSLVEAGHTMISSEYFIYYYAITGLHLVHVCVGVTVLTVIALFAWKSPVTPRRLTAFESGCSYWHMVDLLWLVILPLFYVMN